MDYWDVLKRSLDITWRHKSLWLFGFLQALFNAGGNFRFPSGAGDFEEISRNAPSPQIYETFFTPLIIIILILAGIILLLLAIFVSFLSQGALIGQVLDVQETGKTSLKNGFRHGFRSWLYLFGIGLIVWVPFTIGLLIVGGILALPAIIGFLAQKIALGIILAILAVFPLIGLIIVTAIPLSLITVFAFRFRVVERTKVFESVREGYRLFRENLGPTLLMWLILVVVGMVTGGAFFIIAFFVAVPVFLLATLNFWFIIPVAIPALLGLAFLGGLLQVFFSSVWTLTFFSFHPPPQAAQSQI